MVKARTPRLMSFRLAAALCAAALVSGTAGAQALSGQDILRRLSGTWETDPSEVREPARENGELRNRCHLEPTWIEIVRTDEGAFYSSWRGGEARVVRAPVVTFEDSIGVGYDNAGHIASGPPPLRWKIYMPDSGRAYAVLAQRPDSRYSMHRRCAPPPVS